MKEDLGVQKAIFLGLQSVCVSGVFRLKEIAPDV